MEDKKSKLLTDSDEMQLQTKPKVSKKKKAANKVYQNTVL